MSLFSILNYTKHLFSEKHLCNAPFSSIYISGDGSITPCCFNRSYIYGNIYDSPLHEILKNSKFSEFKDLIKTHKFPVGCDICKKHVQEKNKSNSGIATYENFPIQKNHLSVIEFELSYKCNLRCTMCRLNEAHLFVNDVRTNNIKFTIKEQIAQVVKNIKLMRFHGGEPFFIEEYYSIWEQTININPNCNFFVQTNGTIYNQRIESIIKKGNFNFNMSLDSVDKDIYESIRMGAHFENSFQNLFKFKQIAEFKGKTMSISVCPMRINYKNIPALLEFCNKNNLFIFFNTVFSPWNMAIWSMSQNELTEIFNYYKSFKFSANSKVKIINTQRWKSFLNQVSNWIENAKRRPHLSENEIGNAKNQIYCLIKNKTDNFLIQQNIIINFNQLKIKVTNSLDEILKFVPVKTLIEKINNADAKTIYIKVIDKDENSIKENIIIP